MVRLHHGRADAGVHLGLRLHRQHHVHLGASEVILERQLLLPAHQSSRSGLILLVQGSLLNALLVISSLVLYGPSGLNEARTNCRLGESSEARQVPSLGPEKSPWWSIFLLCLDLWIFVGRTL